MRRSLYRRGCLHHSASLEGEEDVYKKPRSPQRIFNNEAQLVKQLKNTRHQQPDYYISIIFISTMKSAILSIAAVLTGMVCHLQEY